MSYLVLARKWRPQTFDEVVGQAHVTQTLQNAIRSGRVAHAFVFTGPRGVGKTTTARILAKALNCEQGPTPEPCNTCSNCTEVTNGSAIDVLEIDGASHTGVDHVRDLTEGLQYRPAKGRFRVVIIDEVHMLSKPAFNALLKTLEEPPGHVKFVFATTESDKILPTILSRCQRHDFRRIPLRDLMQQLGRLAHAEGFASDEAGLALVAREADGSLRDAETLLDQVVAWSDGRVDEASVKDALGVAGRQALFEIVDVLLAQDPAEVLRLTGMLHQSGYDPSRLCHDLLEHFHHLTVCSVGGDPALLSDLPDHELELVQRQAAGRTGDDLRRYFSLLLRTEEELRRSEHEQLVIEMGLVRLASQPPVLAIDDTLAKLDELQRLLSGRDSGVSPRPEIPSPKPAAAPRPRTTATPPDRASDPTLRPASSPAPPPSASESPTAPVDPPSSADHLDRDAQWNGFLASVKKRKVTLFFTLQPGSLLELTDTYLRIGVDHEPYVKELSRKESRTALEASAEECFGRKLTVEIVKTGSAASANGAPPSPTPYHPAPAPESRVAEGPVPTDSPPSDLHPTEETAVSSEPSQPPAPQSTEDDPLVKTALDVLGGEVYRRLPPRAMPPG